MIDIDPGTEGDLRRRRSCSPGCTGPRSTTSACEACPKVTGKRGHPDLGAGRRGLHVRRHQRRGWRRCRAPSGDTVPDLVSWEWEKAKRGGRTRLDYTQNAINKTLVAPFSARPAPGAPVSVPITLGRARRPRPAPRPLDDPHRRRPPGRGRRPARPADRAPAAAPGAVTNAGQVRVGCSGWSYKDWRGAVYPADAPARTWFSLVRRALRHGGDQQHLLPAARRRAPWRRGPPRRRAASATPSRSVSSGRTG